MNKIFGFPGYADIPILLAAMLISSSQNWGLCFITACAAFRVLIYFFLFKRLTALSPKGLKYDLILMALSAIYIIVWGDGWQASVLAYIGGAAATEFFYVLLSSKLRFFR